jgi:hypothetical protein
VIGKGTLNLSEAEPQPTYPLLESANRRIGESASGASTPEDKLTGRSSWSITIMKTKPSAPKNRALNPFEAADTDKLVSLAA